MPDVLLSSSALATSGAADVLVVRLDRYFNIFPTCIVCKQDTLASTVVVLVLLSVNNI